MWSTAKKAQRKAAWHSFFNSTCVAVPEMVSPLVLIMPRMSGAILLTGHEPLMASAYWGYPEGQDQVSSGLYEHCKAQWGSSFSYSCTGACPACEPTAKCKTHPTTGPMQNRLRLFEPMEPKALGDFPKLHGSMVPELSPGPVLGSL